MLWRLMTLCALCACARATGRQRRRHAPDVTSSQRDLGVPEAGRQHAAWSGGERAGGYPLPTQLPPWFAARQSTWGPWAPVKGPRADLDRVPWTSQGGEDR